MMKFIHDKLFVVDSVGKSGGLDMSRRLDIVITTVLFTDFTIELKIEDNCRNTSWLFMCIYASTKIRSENNSGKQLNAENRFGMRNGCLLGI